MVLQEYLVKYTHTYLLIYCKVMYSVKYELIFIRVKVDLSVCLIKHHTIRLIGSGGVTLPFLTSEGEWSASYLVRFTPRERTPVSLNRRLVGPQSRSGRCGEERTRFLDRTARSLVTTSADL
jgi:hypothetical protein